MLLCASLLLGKGIDPSVLLVVGKIVGQTGFFSLGQATNLEDGKL